MQRSKTATDLAQTLRTKQKSVSLGRSVGADDILHLVGVRVQEGERRRPQPHPVTRFRAESVHYRHDLPLELEHLLEALFHVVHVFRVEEVEANLAEQLGR